jgi:nucleoside-diphosphate-sugar epimerase
MNFQGKNILVVGGSSGVGLALVKLLAAKGAQVYSASRNTSSEWPAGTIHIPFDVLDFFNELVTAFIFNPFLTPFFMASEALTNSVPTTSLFSGSMLSKANISSAPNVA